MGSKAENSMIQLHSIAWDTLGTRVAAACKDKKLRILEPRKPSSNEEGIVTGPCHDSMRPVKVIWANSTFLITCGFSRSAFREILLHGIANDGKTIGIITKVNIDVSPAPLFPYYDQDTSILYAYSKGERTCHAFEITNLPQDNRSNSNNQEKPSFNKLPRFEHGTLQLSFAFLPKQKVNVKEVDITHAFRLTSNSVMYVRFNIPRAKMDYFQDDIYNGGITRELMRPDTSLSIEDWMNGKDPVERFVNIRPEGMPLCKSLLSSFKAACLLFSRILRNLLNLWPTVFVNTVSEAPPPPPRVKQQILAKQQSAEESQQAYLDSLFKHKQAEVDSDEDEQRVKERDAADDDDDW